MDARIKKHVKETVIPPYNQESLERTICAAKKIQMHPERYLINEYQFFVDQLRFIQKKTWLLKIFCTVAFFILIKTFGKETTAGWSWSIVAIMGPLFCLINANELFGVCQQGITELQMTTHFTSPKIMIARLIAFGMFDILFLGAASVHVSHAYDSAFLQVLLYGAVPYNLMCFGCMEILSRSPEEEALFYCAGYGAALMGTVTISRISGVNLFSEELLVIWALLEVVTIIAALAGMKEFLRKAGRINHEINTGSTF